jgi:hypothetical protein
MPGKEDPPKGIPKDIDARLPFLNPNPINRNLIGKSL